MIPFNWMPGSWGLRGKTYRFAQAEYELDGEELDYELCKIEHEADQLDEDEVPSLNFQKHYLALDFKYHKISKEEHDLELATLEEKPYIYVKASGYNFEEGIEGFWQELEWNSYFIDFLVKNGYDNISEEDTIDEWMTDIYKSQIIEQEIGLDMGDPRIEPLQEPEDFTNVVDLGEGIKSYE